MCTAAPMTDPASLADSADRPEGLVVGMRVRVSRSIIMYHYPGKKNEAVDVEGFEGEIIKDISVEDGVQMSATAPFLINFSESHPKFKAHLAEDELEAVE